MKKKLFKTLLTLFMIITFIKPIHALDSTFTVWVSGIDKTIGATITPYQLISVETDGIAPKTPTYKWEENIIKWLKENGYEKYVDEEGYVSEYYMNLSNDSTEVIEFVDAISSAVREGLHLKQMETVKVTPYDAISKIDIELPLGSYLFIVSDGIKIYSSCIVNSTFEYKNDKWMINTNDIELSFKSHMPTITKKAEDIHVGISDIILFSLDIEVPQYSKTMTKTNIMIQDQLPIGMNLIEDSIVIKYEDIDLTQIFDIQTTNDSFTCTLDTKDLNEYSNITITYQATMNEHAYLKESLINQATLTYDVNPYSNEETLYSIQDELQLYTYGVKFNLNLEDETTKTGIFNCSDLKFRKVDNFYVLDENGSKELVMDESGVIWIKGLDLGSYELKHVKTSDGYPLPQDTIQFKLIDDDSDGSLDAVSMNYKENRVDHASVEENQLNFNVYHYKHDFQLPNTGSSGTLLFMLSGIGCILIGFVFKKDEE